MSDTLDLIVRWKDGDQQAAEALYNLHRDRTWRLAWGLLGDREDAEEVAQDTLAYALINIERYDPDRALFTTWLHTIAVSRVRDRQRRKRFSLTSLTEWLELGREPVSEEPSLEQESSTDFVKIEVWRALETLTPQLREAIVLRYWAQHSFKEMAEILECPLGTAQSRVRRGFEALRKVVAPELLAQLEG